MMVKKLLFIILTVILSVVNKDLSAQDKNPKLRYSCEFLNNGNHLEGVVIKIFQDSVKVCTYIANRYGRALIELNYKEQYLLEFSKKGFVTQSILFNTELPNSVYKRDASSFYVEEEIEMFEAYPGVDTKFFDQHISEYKWNKDEYFFIKNSTYEKRIKKEENLNQFKSQLEKKQSEIFENRVEEAESLLNKQKYEDAGYYLTLAHYIKPKDKEVSAKIKQLKKQMKSLGLIEDGYQTAIEKGDQYFEEKDLEKSKKEYQNAVFYKADEAYPLEQIALIDSITSQQYLEIVNNYDQAIDAGNKYFTQEDYHKAEEQFIKAGELLPEKELPKIKLSQIQEKIKEKEIIKKRAEEQKQKEILEKLNLYLAQGDQFFDQKKYSEALEMFEKAFEVNKDNKKAIQNIIKTKAIIERLKNYNAEIQLADQYFKENNWGKAEEKYNVALKYDPQATYPKNQLKKISEKSKTGKEEIQEKEEIVEEESIKEEPVESKKDDTSHLVNEEIIPAIDSIQDNNKESLFSYYMNKLKTSKQNNDRKEESKDLKNIGNLYHSEENLGKAIEYYQKSIDILETEGDVNGMSDVMSELAVALFDSGLYESSIEKYEKAANIKQEAGDKKAASELLNDIGIVYESTFQFDNAIASYNKSLELKKQTNDKEGVSEIFNNLADVYYQQKDLELSLENYKKSLEITEELKNTDKKGALMNDIGVTLYELGRYDEAIEYYTQSLDIQEKSENKKEVSMTLNNIGNVKFDWNEYDNAISYYEKSLALKEEINYGIGIAISLFNIANAYEKLKKYEKALKFYIRSEKEAAKNNSEKQIQSKIIYSIARMYSLTGQYEEAYNYQDRFIDIGIFESKTNQLISEKRERFEAGKSKREIKYLKRKIQQQKILADIESTRKQREIERKNLELQYQAADLKRRQILNFLFGSIILFIAIITLSIYKLLQNKKKANLELQEKNELISEQSNHIKDSITYASRIQRAAMPQPDLMDKLLKEYFVFNKPLDIVSGDFYWLSEHNDNIVLSVADCTGHGVPGAMMCMLGISFLDEIIKGKKVNEPNIILDSMRGQVMELLHQKGELFELSDGIDMALCIFNKDRNEVNYAGANNPLCIVSDGKIIEYKPDRMPVSYSYKTDNFHAQKIPLKKGDMLYLYSDGYMDQLGGPRRTRMMRRRFRQLLESISPESMEKQKELLNNYLLEWIGDEFHQVDDILIVGIRI